MQIDALVIGLPDFEARVASGVPWSRTMPQRQHLALGRWAAGHSGQVGAVWPA
jgi:hypothetical protein